MKLRQNRLKPLSVRWICGEPADAAAIVQRLTASSARSVSTAASSPGTPTFAGYAEQLLTRYEADRRSSILARLFRLATALHGRVDRVVIVGAAEQLAAGRLLVESSGQPLRNELTRGQRGSKPKLHFIESSDNDALAAWLDLLGGRSSSFDPQHAWALVLVGDNADHSPLQPAAEALLDQLRRRLPPSTPLDDYAIAIAPEGSWLMDLCDRYKLTPVFGPGDAPEFYQPLLSIESLAASAAIGLNVIEILQGAAYADRTFMSEASSNSIDTIYLWAVAYAAYGSPPHTIVEADALKRVSVWLRNCDLERAGAAAPPDDARGSYSWVEQIVAAEPRSDRVSVPADTPTGSLDPVAARERQILQRQENWIASRLPALEITIQRCDELHIGQLLQMMLWCRWLASAHR